MTPNEDRDAVSGHISPSQAERYRQHDLTGDELRALDRHLEQCEECGLRLMTPAGQESALHALRDDISLDTGHLSYEQKEALVEDNLSRASRANLEAHLSHCRRCREDVEALRQARPILVRPLAIARSDTTSRVTSARSNFTWQSLRGLSLAMGGAMAAAALGFLFLLRPLQQENARLSLAQTHNQAQESARFAALQQERDQAVAEAARARQDAQKQAAALQQAVGQQKAFLDRQTAQLTQQNADLNRKLERQAQDLQKAMAFNKQLNVSEQAALQRWQQTGEAPMRVSANLNTGAMHHITRGGDPAFGPAAPIGTGVASSQPLLRWNPRRPDDRYQVVVHRIKDGKIVAQTTMPIRDTNWTVNRALDRGVIYSWQVFAVSRTGERQAPDGDPQPRFEVMSSEVLRRYLEARTELAILDASNGLYDAAEAIVKEVIEADPNEPASRKAVSLLESIRKQREAPPTVEKSH